MQPGDIPGQANDDPAGLGQDLYSQVCRLQRAGHPGRALMVGAGYQYCQLDAQWCGHFHRLPGRFGCLHSLSIYIWVGDSDPQPCGDCPPLARHRQERLVAIAPDSKGSIGGYPVGNWGDWLWYMTLVFSGGSNSGNLSLILGLAFAAFFVGLAICAGSITWMLIWLVKQAKQVQTNKVPTREHGTSRSRPHTLFCNGVA